jgi:hypothetical protein
MRVEVYWNLTKGCWSIRSTKTGRLIEDRPHRKVVDLKDVTWVVQPGGRARVLKQQRKNVHAFARGTMVPSVPALDARMSELNSVSYNPYKVGTFINPLTSQAVKVSQYARLTMRYLVTNDPRCHGVARAYAVNLEGGAS